MGDETSSTQERYISQPAIMQQQDISKYMLDAHKDMIKEVERMLKGQEMQQREIVKIGKAEMNQEGIKQVVQTLRMSMGANIFLSVFTKDDILSLCQSLEFELNQKFTDKWNDWKLEPEKIPIIIQLVMLQVRASLNRAREFNKEYGAFGGTTQAFTQTTATHEVISREKKGFNFPKILGGGDKNA